MAIPTDDLIEFVARRMEPKFRVFPGNYSVLIAREIAIVAITAQREFLERARVVVRSSEIIESAPVPVSSLPSGESDPAVTSGCAGADTLQQTPGA